MALHPKVLIFDEPTRGIDVGAKSEIYSIIRQLAAEGKSIMIFSSELPEVVNICDTIYLFYDGSMQGTIHNGGDIDSEMIIRVCVVGGGNLGRAIINYFSGKRTKLSIVAVFDSNPEKVGKKYSGVTCYGIDQIGEMVRQEDIKVELLQYLLIKAR